MLEIKMALTFAYELGKKRIIYQKLSTQNLHVPHAAIVKEIKTRATMFLSCIFLHVRRCCNVAAHALAKSAEHDVGSCWFSEVPAVIRTIICTEQIMNE
jgi:hypothetical protein